MLLKIFLIAIGGAAGGVEGMIAVASMIVIYTIGTEITIGVGAYLYSAIIWQVLPGFISDFVFYFAVYIQKQIFSIRFPRAFHQNIIT